MTRARATGAWTDEEILRESGRWVHVPPSGARVEDAESLLVHLPHHRGTSRVWRSRPDRTGAEALILRTIEGAHAAGARRLIWHTGDAVSPAFMDDLLPRHGFVKTEDLDVLAFELGAGPEPGLPALRPPLGVRPRLIEDKADLVRANAVAAGVFPTATWDATDTRAYLAGLSDQQGTPAGGARDHLDDSSSRVFRYIASLEDPDGNGWVDAAAAGMEVAGETARLWGAGTLPGHRGRGAYRTLVMERCRHAQALGATLALAKANTTSSSPILRAAGFRRVATERRYALEMPVRATRQG